MGEEKEEKIELSIIIPVFNEEEAISGVLKHLVSYLNRADFTYEIIVVNDGSHDGTNDALKTFTNTNAYILSHPYNRGYGAAIKTGASHARGKFIAIYDGDGQHNPEELLKLTKERDAYDMVVGARTKYNAPMWRKPGKKFITMLANYLVAFKIKDLNSGLRVVRKDLFDRFVHLYPEGFSLSSTITLALLKEGHTVHYIPIEVPHRKGKSSLSARDGFNTIALMLRLIMLFAPFKIFAPLSLVFFVGALGSLYVDLFVYNFNLSESTLIFSVTALLLFIVGLLADQLAAIRRELGSN